MKGFLQGLIAHFFLVPNNIPLSACISLSIHLLQNILITSKFWQLWIKLLYTLLCRFLCGHKLSTPLRADSTKEHSCWIVCKNMFCKKLPSCLPGWLYHFSFPPAVKATPLLLHILANIWCVSWILAILMGVWWYLIVLICISWWHMMKRVSFHMLLCHLSIFGEVSRFLVRFFNSMCVCVCFKHSVYILNKSFIKCLTNILSQSVACLLIRLALF